MSGARYLIRRHAVVLALLVASLAVSEQAKAACDPTSPVSNTTVTCTGLSRNGNDGYGTAADTGNTYNVLSSASVLGTDIGLTFSAGTVNNSGDILGGQAGISAGTTATVNNSGSILGTGANSAGISAGTAATVNNRTISCTSTDVSGSSRAASTTNGANRPDARNRNSPLTIRPQ